MKPIVLIVALIWAALFGALCHGFASGDPWWLLGGIVGLVLLPPSIDPAIMIKEKRVRRGLELKARNGRLEHVRETSSFIDDD